MKNLDRYIGQIVQVSVLAAMSVILVIFALSKFVNEFDRIGQNDFTTTVASLYVLLWMPKMIYEIFPMAALLGTMLGLGTLANSSELVVIRAAGVSKLRIAGSVVKSMLVLTLIVFFVGEVIAPDAEQYAEQMKLKALESRVSLNTEYGLWIRDGNTYINVRSIDLDGNLKNISLTILDNKTGITRIIKARTARYTGEEWQMENVFESHVSLDG
ncbi:LptF/LptG family permease, partial [Kaarinaea lacus]